MSSSYSQVVCYCVIVITILHAVDAAVCHNCAHTATPSSNQVDFAIDNGLDSGRWGDSLCLEILLVNCDNHVTQGDEAVCGTNGHDYPNHCVFAHARCEYIHASEQLKVAHFGTCSNTTTTSSPMATTVGAPGSVSTLSTAPATVDPIQAIMQNVFCSNADHITCQGTVQEVLCGSDGNVYPNTCYISKAKCTDSTLTVVDNTHCNI
ncbi:hypothetical protein ACF0H5_008219 [Mactra antiquata]